MPQLLSNAIRSDPLAAAQGDGAERVHWVECFTGNERVSDFCEATDPAGCLESNSSKGHKEYQDRLRAIALREEGKEKAEIATALGRSQGFVQTWWRKEPKEVPKPAGVHEYLKTEFWRDIQIVRGFAKGLGIYDEVVPSTEWSQPMADGYEFKGAGQRLKYDKEGRMRPQGNQNCKDGLVPGRNPALDKVTQRLLVEQGIDDRVMKRPGLLWYPDGSSSAIEHRHEAWTALLSFGAPRILTMDKQPVLLRDGDLIVFGTQRHGVPKMRVEEDARTFEDYGGRISVVFFFMPTGQQAGGAEPWKAIFDGPSRKMTAMVRDADLGSKAQMQGLLAGPKGADMSQLVALGFSAEEAAAALKATAFDVERAAEVLLGGGGPALMMGLSEGGGNAESFLTTPTSDRNTRIAALYKRLEELQRERTQHAVVVGGGASCSSASGSASSVESDEALARRLQQEDAGLARDSPGEHWEEAAVMEQLQVELEGDELAGGCGEALKSQFAAYDEMLEAEDAKDWDGRGDLMLSEWRRGHMHIEQQDPATLYAFGCGTLSEQVFFELLSLHSIRVLYDFRADPRTALGKHFSRDCLEVSCKSRGLTYRHVALGRDSAYGILKHLKEDEGRNSIAEIVWHAQRKRSAILGAEEDWRKDHRLAIAVRLVEAGHQVLHVRSDGGTEEHPAMMEIPDHLAKEESRLRLLEKQRQAGELQRPQKSAANRSTESVAQRLAAPKQEVDAGAELRKARTQQELCRAQRRLADLQRKAEDDPDAKAFGPKLLQVNKWVKAEAAQQREHLAAGRTKDGKEKAAPKTDAPAPGALAAGPVASCAEPPSDDLLVECLACSASLPWAELEEGDGVCGTCRPGPAPCVDPPSLEEPSLRAARSAPAPSNADAPPDEVCGGAAPAALDGRPGQATWRSRRKAQRAAKDA